MRNLKSIIYCSILSVMIVCGIESCKKSVEGSGPPTITRVRTVYKSVIDSNVVHPVTLDSSTIYNQGGVAAFDSTTNDGQIGTLYAIIGNNLASVTGLYINGVSVYFNTAYLSNTTLEFSIPNTVPYSNATTNNTLTIVSKYGKANYQFVVEQPVPTITTVDQLAGNPGDVITITGTTFNGLSGVSFGTVAGTVLTSSPTILTVKVPSGVTDGPILVTTAATKGGGIGTGPTVSAGITTSSAIPSAQHFANAVFGFSTAVFEDSFENNWGDYGWSNSPSVDNTVAKRGTSSIKVAYNGGYDGFVLQPGDNSVDANTAIKFSIYGGKGTTGKILHLILNYNFNIAVVITLTEGKWTDYEIPIKYWVDANNPMQTSLNALVFQEFSGNASVFNLDDVGLTDVKP